MTEAEDQSRHAELAQQINDARFQYYVLDAPTLTDAGFDALMAELQALEEAHPEFVTPESPSQQVGGGLAHQHYGLAGVFTFGVVACAAWLGVASGMRPPAPLSQSTSIMRSGSTPESIRF